MHNVCFNKSSTFTYHTNGGQPHLTSKWLEKSKVVDGWLICFLHNKTQTEVHEGLTKVNVLLALGSYRYRCKCHILFLTGNIKTKIHISNTTPSIHQISIQDTPSTVFTKLNTTHESVGPFVTVNSIIVDCAVYIQKDADMLLVETWLRENTRIN